MGLGTSAVAQMPRVESLVLRSGCDGGLELQSIVDHVNFPLLRKLELIGISKQRAYRTVVDPEVSGLTLCYSSIRHETPDPHDF